MNTKEHLEDIVISKIRRQAKINYGYLKLAEVMNLDDIKQKEEENKMMERYKNASIDSKIPRLTCKPYICKKEEVIWKLKTH